MGPSTRQLGYGVAPLAVIDGAPPGYEGGRPMFSPALCVAISPSAVLPYFEGARGPLQDATFSLFGTSSHQCHEPGKPLLLY